MLKLNQSTSLSTLSSYQDARETGRLSEEPQMKSNPFDDSAYIISDDSAPCVIPTKCVGIEDRDTDNSFRHKSFKLFSLRLSTKKKWLLLASIVIIIILVVALAVDEGRKKSNGSKRPVKQTGLAPVYLGSEYNNLALFYQDEGGDLRYDQTLEDGSWKQGNHLGINDAIEKTPIAVITYYDFVS